MSRGLLETSLAICAFEKPWVLSMLRTESAFLGVCKCISLEAERAEFNDNPHEFMRYETVKECSEADSAASDEKPHVFVKKCSEMDSDLSGVEAK